MNSNSYRKWQMSVMHGKEWNNMTREEQRIIREQNAQIPSELRKLCKQYNLKYAYDTLYRFEGDFLYYSHLTVRTTMFDVLGNSQYIKPWILNKLYWEIFEMDMEKFLKKPKTFHFRSAFAINDIYYGGENTNILPETFLDSVRLSVEQFCCDIEKHKKILTGVDVITRDVEGYRISNLTKAIAFMYLSDYESAYSMLITPDNINDIEHVDSQMKSSKEYALEYCRAKMGG